MLVIYSYHGLPDDKSVLVSLMIKSPSTNFALSTGGIARVTVISPIFGVMHLGRGSYPFLTSTMPSQMTTFSTRVTALLRSKIINFHWFRHALINYGRWFSHTPIWFITFILFFGTGPSPTYFQNVSRYHVQQELFLQHPLRCVDCLLIISIAILEILTH